MTQDENEKLNQKLFLTNLHEIFRRWGLSINVKEEEFSIPIKYGLYHFNTEIPEIRTYGLSHIEQAGRWSDGKVVFIQFRLPKRQSLKIEFDLFSFLVEKRPYQTAEVFVGENKKAKWTFEMGKPSPKTEFIINKNEISEDNLVTIKFEIDNPISPKDVEFNDDVRKLAIGFGAIKISKQ